MWLAVCCNPVASANMVFHLSVVYDHDRDHDHDPGPDLHLYDRPRDDNSTVVVLGSILLVVENRAVVNMVYHRNHCHSLCKMMVDKRFGHVHNNHNPDGILDSHHDDWDSNKYRFRLVEHQLIRKYLDLGHWDRAYN